MTTDPDFICTYEPFTAVHVAVIHGKLSSTGIRYYITNEHYTGGGGVCDGATLFRKSVATESPILYALPGQSDIPGTRAPLGRSLRR